MPIPDEFTITDGFPGTYKRAGGRSWYLNGDTSAGTIHFSINGTDLSAWHITYSLTGTNIGIWYHGATFSNVNENNIPGSKYAAWVQWNEDNWRACDAAAADLYNQFG